MYTSALLKLALATFSATTLAAPAAPPSQYATDLPSESCDVVFDSPGPGAICSQLTKEDAFIPQHIISAVTVTNDAAGFKQCQKECQRDPECDSNFMFKLSDGVSMMCYMVDYDHFTSNTTMVPDPNSRVNYVERSCYKLTGRCDLHNPGFEEAGFLNDGRPKAHPWLIRDSPNQGGYGNYPDKSTNPKIGKFGKKWLDYYIGGGTSAIFTSQVIKAVENKPAKLSYTYNFYGFYNDDGGKIPEEYPISITYCGQQLDSFTVKPAEAKNRWITRSKTVTPKTCINKNSIFSIEARVNGVDLKDQSYSASIAFDNIRFVPA